MKTIALFLDIDGVLNNQESHKLISSLFSTFGAPNSESLCREYEQDLDWYVKFYRKRHNTNMGDYITIELMDNLTELIEHLEVNYVVQVVGISSWFTCKDLHSIGSFLGLDIQSTTDYTGGGHKRAESVRAYIDANDIGNNYIVLDDMEDQYCNWTKCDILNKPFIDGKLGFDDVSLGLAKSIIFNN